jgi:uncharacterized phiE125 gp8 family phage protein
MYPTLRKPGRLAEKQAEGLELVVLQQPAIEPVSLEEVKAFCKIDGDYDDDLIKLVVRAVRVSAEVYSNCSFMTQQLRAYWEWMNDYAILPRPPIQSVDKVELFDGSTWQTISKSGYLLKGEVRKRIYFQRIRFSISGGGDQSARVEYTAGFGEHEEEIGDAIIAAILDSTLFCYQNRGELFTEVGKPIEGVLTALSKSHLDTIKNYN